mgnify:FL=1
MNINDDHGSKEILCGDLRILPSQNRILVDNRAEVVQPKVMQLLLLLCNAHGQTLTREFISKTLWPDVVVGPESLANLVARLRRSLNDSAKQPVFIETVQSIGYRWLVPIDSSFHSNLSRKKTLIVTGTLITTLVIVSQSFLEAPTGSRISDLKITPKEQGVEIAVAVEANSDTVRPEDMLSEVQRLTGLDASNAEIKVTVDDETELNKD